MTRKKLKSVVKRAVEDLQKKGELPEFAVRDIRIERPVRKDQGDYSTAIAMQAASLNRRKPKTLAKIIRAELKKDEALKNIVSDIRVASPGFINFYLSDEYLKKSLWGVFSKKDYGRINIGRDKPVNLEFVSTNPTGELHVGHARTAFYGDVLARILERTRFNVTREYYVNNAKQSAQIKELGKTALKKGTSYRSPYLDKKIKKYSKNLKRIKKFETAGYFLSQKIQKDVKEFLEKDVGIRFDVWFEEEGLYKKGEVEKVLKELKKRDLVYEKEGALWLKTTKFGDSHDQVIVRSTKENTYFISDIAYHVNKQKRGFEKMIDIWGSDHQGHAKRMKAAAKMFKIKDLNILVAQMVRLKGGEKLSKRKGNIVTVKDLVDYVGIDAVRYFYLTKSLDTQMEFDMDLARKQSQKNPVYYIQYTHARICSILCKSEILNSKHETNSKSQTLNSKPQIRKSDLEALKEKGEFDLIRKLVVFPEIIEDIAKDYQVHRLTTYLHELSQQFNQFYRDFKVISDNKEEQAARLAVVISTGVIIKECLELLGISAPEKM
ncbi:MAG: arginine--tRNA ligase [Candidatus Spechtbacterales bacterium]